MAEITPQPVTIRLENDQVIVDPPIRDLFRNEEVEWVCQENTWEIIFEDINNGGDEQNSPFISNAFGPGMNGSFAQPDAPVGIEEFPRYLTGQTRPVNQDPFDFRYTAQLGSGRTRSGLVRVFRRIRPH